MSNSKIHIELQDSQNFLQKKRDVGAEIENIIGEKTSFSLQIKVRI